MKIKSLKAIVLLAFLFAIPTLSQANELQSHNTVVVSSPIDLWLLVLIGAGALYGVFKMWNSNQSVK